MKLWISWIGVVEACVLI